MKTTYTTLNQIKIDTQNGKTVYWQNYGYIVKQSKFEPGDFNVVCSNGHCAFLSNDYKPEDFYTLEA